MAVSVARPDWSRYSMLNLQTRVVMEGRIHLTLPQCFAESNLETALPQDAGSSPGSPQTLLSLGRKSPPLG